MKKNPEKHVCAWGPLPSQITVHVFDSKGKREGQLRHVVGQVVRHF